MIQLLGVLAQGLVAQLPAMGTQLPPQVLLRRRQVRRRDAIA
jgi:hypothetical protein